MIATTETIWESFHGRLRQFILRRVPDEQNAEDILQEVFLKVHLHIDALRDEQRLESWLYQIARNAIADYYRSRRKESDLPDTLLLPAVEDTLDDVVRELIPCVRAMVDSLPDDYRQALILTEYEGLTQKEMGEQLGLSCSGAKSRVQRAREKLKDMLLTCCHFEFDHFGSIIDYQPHCC
ncbi:MAG TPA: RNA polymerase sigma factor SigZ [Ktedonobacteraceae bacterium]|nr:RNA polymerase sigma factor SigZ [Ktedonobacteraceae bacterium]